MNTMKMPASYNVMNEEEMTYTQGGSISGTVITLAQLALAGVSIYNEFWAAQQIGSFVKGHKGQDTSTAINAAVDQFTSYVQKDVTSAIVGVYSVWNQLKWWPVTAIYCLATAM